MRGKDNQTASAANSTGITPAYAGKSHCHPGQCGRNGDHPRVCGEKKIQAQKDYRRLGSPPRMRGKVSGQEREQAHRGDHPRVCGEKEQAHQAERKEQGSPPRMRGKELVLLAMLSPLGITPAYAGKRLKRSRSTVPPVAIVPLFPSVCNKPVVSDGSPAGRDAPLFLPAENAVPASPAYNLRSL